jgi:hypothetical protein
MCLSKVENKEGVVSKGSSGKEPVRGESQSPVVTLASNMSYNLHFFSDGLHQISLVCQKAPEPSLPFTHHEQVTYLL